MIGTQIAYVYGVHAASYHVGMVYDDSGVQKPWGYTINENGHEPFAECYDVPLIGTYDKVNNKNLIVADFYSDTSSTNMEWILRSVDAGGLVIFVFNNRLIQVAFSLQDEGNQILDGKLMNYYRMKDSYGVGMIYVTQSSNSSYINQYVIFKRFHHVIRDTFIPVLETTNYFAKPLFLAQGMYENKTGLHYHLMMEVKIKNPDGTNTTHLSNSRFLAEIDADPMIFTGHYLFPRKLRENLLNILMMIHVITFFSKTIVMLLSKYWNLILKLTIILHTGILTLVFLILMFYLQKTYKADQTVTTGLPILIMVFLILQPTNGILVLIELVLTLLPLLWLIIAKWVC